MNKDNKIIIAILISLVIILVFGEYRISGFDNYSMRNMMNGFYQGYSLNWFLGETMMILIIIFLTLGILWLIKQLQGGKK